MTYACEECGQEFDTLSRLRVHECPSVMALGAPTDGEAANSETAPTESEQSVAQTYPDLVGELPSLVEEAGRGDKSALYQALGEYEQAMSKAIEQRLSPDDPMYSDLLFAYYKPLADAVESIAQADGWEFLIELMDAYDIRADDVYPSIAHVLVNGVGRMLIRTRHTDGIEAVPVEALEYLAAVPETSIEERLVLEDSYTYGWGIGHPSHSVGDHLCATAPTHHNWTHHTLKAALYADQHAAIDVFEQLLTTQDLDGTTDALPYTVDLERYYFGIFADVERDAIKPPGPLDWDWEPIDEQSYELTSEVEQRLRTLVAEHEIDEKLPDDWTPTDLDPTLLSDLLDAAEER